MRIFLKKFYLLFDFVLNPNIIRVDMSDVLALCTVQTLIVGIGNIEILRQGVKLYPVVVIAFYNFRRVIRRTVVNNDNLQIFIGLIKHAFKSLSDYIGAVISVYANADKFFQSHIPLRIY